jgi:hypothetical protein
VGDPVAPCPASKTELPPGGVPPTPAPTPLPGPTPKPTPGPDTAHIAVHVQTKAGDPIQGVTVSVDGLPLSGPTDKDGNLDFGNVPPNTYTVKGQKSGLTPASQQQTAPANVLTKFTLVMDQCVTQIKAKVAGTKGKRDATKTRPAATLRTSTSSDESLSANAPVILIRGCPTVDLEAVTNPPDTPVSWTVKPNQNSESAPTITPTDGGKKAKLQTDKTGSFSVVATLGSCKVVWNVVFAWVKVDPASSVITSQDTEFKDGGSGGGSTVFKSGDFPTAKYAWEAKVKLQVIGGGNDGKLGVGKVKVHVLQNGVTDTLTGNYKDGGTALEVPKGGLPVVDATSASSPFITSPRAAKVTPANASLTDSDKDRDVWTGDSPAGGFRSTHQNSGKPLESITGVNAFLTAIASTSDDAPDAIVVHAQTAWTADFKGKVDATGKYTTDGAKITKDAAYALVSQATGGQDACDAGFETFEPRFNGGTNTTWNP